MSCVSTRSKTGALADLHGVYRLDGMATIEVRKSSICDGLGVFAKRKIYRHDLITSYSGHVMRADETPKDNAYVFEKESFADRKNREVYVGIAELSELKGRGVAQLVNDAISPCLTGKRNNSHFYTNERGVYIQALCDIEPGEEILVSYGFYYWSGHISSKPFKFGEKYVLWLELMERFAEMLKTVDPSAEIYQIDEFDDTNTLKIILHNTLRRCPYTHRNHFDDIVYLTLKKTENNMCDVFYKCQTCGLDSKKLGSYIVTDGLV